MPHDKRLQPAAAAATTGRRGRNAGVGRTQIAVAPHVRSRWPWIQDNEGVPRRLRTATAVIFIAATATAAQFDAPDRPHRTDLMKFVMKGGVVMRDELNHTAVSPSAR